MNDRLLLDQFFDAGGKKTTVFKFDEESIPKKS
jgi:hypothetical protein